MTNNMSLFVEKREDVVKRWFKTGQDLIDQSKIDQMTNKISNSQFIIGQKSQKMNTPLF